MKQLVVALVLGLSAATPCFAQSTTFSIGTTVQIPCVAVWDSRQSDGAFATYTAGLIRVGMSRQFVLYNPQPMQYGDYCSGVYDLATGVYTDIVNIDDDSYHVTLQRDRDANTAIPMFNLESIAYRGAATTSMWVARNGANTVYLAGTIHILRPGDYPLPRAYMEAYAKSSVLYFEIDMDDPAETGERLTQEQILQLLVDPQGRTLTEVLTPENYTALRNYMRGQNLAIEVTNTWSAQALLGVLYSRDLVLHQGFSADGVDEYIAKRAQQDGKAIHGLESGALHDELARIGTGGDANEAVEAFLHDVSTHRSATRLYATLTAWRSGDTSAIYWNSIVPMREQAYADYLAIHANRNRAWLPRIEAMLQSPVTEMVVVGAAHMAGEEGVVNLLRQRGYTVEKY
jgi:uncharacterized protein YbaP (TraB family)